MPAPHRFCRPSAAPRSFAEARTDARELKTLLADVQVLGPRSRTVLDLAMLEHAPQSRAVGAYCTGTNNIDLRAAAERGVAVFNRSPHWIRTPSMLGCWGMWFSRKRYACSSRTAGALPWRGRRSARTGGERQVMTNSSCPRVTASSKVPRICATCFSHIKAVRTFCSSPDAVPRRIKSPTSTLAFVVSAGPVEDVRAGERQIPACGRGPVQVDSLRAI